MALSLLQIILTLLLVACFASFTWAVRNFFVQPEQRTTGLRLTLLAGFVFVVLHVVVILRSSALQPLWVGLGVLLYLISLAIFWWAIAANRVKPLSACFAQE